MIQILFDFLVDHVQATMKGITQDTRDLCSMICRLVGVIITCMLSKEYCQSDCHETRVSPRSIRACLRAKTHGACRGCCRQSYQRLFGKDIGLPYQIYKGGSSSLDRPIAQNQERIWLLEDLCKRWFNYIETASECRDRLTLIQSIINLQDYMARMVTFASQKSRVPPLAQLVCEYDLDWLAHAICEEDNEFQELLLTDDVLIHAARHSNRAFLFLIQYERTHSREVMQKVTKAAARNWKGGAEIMQLLLETRGEEVQIMPTNPRA